MVPVVIFNALMVSQMDMLVIVKSMLLKDVLMLKMFTHY
jgi:hypothetical protein